MRKTPLDGWPKRDGLEQFYPRDAGSNAAVPGSEVSQTNYASANVDTDKLVGNVAANTRRAQGFKVPSTIYQGAVTVWLKKVGGPADNVQVRIETDSGGKPSGTVVGGPISVAGTALALAYAFIYFRFNLTGQGPSLTAATQYHIVVLRDGAVDAANYYVWGADASAPSYANGQGAVYDGASWTLEATDHAFAVYDSSFWKWGTYTQLVASSGAAFVPTTLHLQVRVSALIDWGVNAIAEFEIATGAAGSEVPFGNFVFAAGNYMVLPGAATQNLASFALSLPIGPTVIPAGTRIAMRLRQGIARAYMYFQCCCYVGGYDGGKVPVGYAPYDLRAHLAGVHRAQTKTAPPGAPVTVTPGDSAWGAWVEAISVAPSDLLVWGLAYTGLPDDVSNVWRTVELGTGASPNEVGRARLGLHGTQFADAGVHHLYRPLLVKRGERLALRAWSASSDWYVKAIVLYEEL